MENFIKIFLNPRALSTEFTFHIPNNMIYKNIYTIFFVRNTDSIKRNTPQKLEFEIK